MAQFSYKPSSEYFAFYKAKKEEPTTMYQLMSRIFLQKYFPRPFLNSGDYQHEFSLRDKTPIVMRSWKNRSRKGHTITVTLTQEESDILYEIIGMIDATRGFEMTDCKPIIDDGKPIIAGKPHNYGKSIIDNVKIDSPKVATKIV